jgi:hypothetical protein
MVRQGLRDMEEADPDRVLFGFFGVAVFGRSVAFALRRLKAFDRPAFERWYGPWKEMETDPLVRFFIEVRDSIVHNIEPGIGVVLTAYGSNALTPGSVTIDRPPPATYRGKSIEDTSMENLCRVYLAYLEEMFESASVVVWEVNDRFFAQGGRSGGGKRSPTQPV